MNYRNDCCVSRPNSTRFILASCLCASLAMAANADDHRMVVRIDDKVDIPSEKAERGMMSMARHPNGTIYLNAQFNPPQLLKSRDNAKTWTAVPLQLKRPHQFVQGFGVNRKGRMFVLHQTVGGHPPNSKDLYGQDLFVSYSDDSGRTWTNSQTDFRKFGPGTPNIKYHEDGNRTFIEQSDGTLMFTTTVVSSKQYKEKYPPTKPESAPNFMYGGKPGDLFSDIVFRSTDDGVTWGDPNQVYPDLNPHESALAIGPNDPKSVLVMTRIQRLVRPGEDGEEMMRITGNPQPYYKQGALFASIDGGRTFQLSKGGFTPWYGHRGTINWFTSNVVVVTHHIGGSGDSRKVVRISLDGGKRWIDGTREGTKMMNESTDFLLFPSVSFTCPTVEISENHFFSTAWGADPHDKGNLYGKFWHLEKSS